MDQTLRVFREIKERRALFLAIQTLGICMNLYPVVYYLLLWLMAPVLQGYFPKAYLVSPTNSLTFPKTDEERTVIKQNSTGFMS